MSTIHHALLIACFACLLAAGAQAATKCEGQEGSTSLSACYREEEFRSEDLALNAIFKRLIKAMEKRNLLNERKLLVGAQRLWVRYRDENCNLHDKVIGGSSGISFVTCRVEQTNLRRLELESLLGAYDER